MSTPAKEERLYVCYDVSMSELEYLRDLLRYETIVRLTLGLKAESDDKVRIYGFMADFDFYRSNDDVLQELIKALKRNDVSSETVVVLKKYADLHEFLLTVTVDGGVPDYLVDATIKLAPNLLDRVVKGLADLYTYEQLSQLKASPRASSGAKEKTADGPNINVFGNNATA